MMQSLFKKTVPLVWMLAAGGLADGAPKPDIIVILSDDMGYSDVGSYGSEIGTPNLDRLAGDRIEERLLIWERLGNAAIRKGDWKLVRLKPKSPSELYDVAKDRSEMNNLAKERPEIRGVGGALGKTRPPHAHLPAAGKLLVKGKSWRRFATAKP